MNEREQFEAAMSAYCDPKYIEETFYRDGEYYQAYATMFAWEAWQASRQAIAAELEALRKLAAVVAREDWRSRAVNVALDALKLASNGGA